MRTLILLGALTTVAAAQEAEAGFELRLTATGEALYTHQFAKSSPVDAAFRALFYPTWKLSKHWAISGAVQVHSSPFFYEEFSEGKRQVETHVLQAHLSYSKYWDKGSVVIRAGALSSAFGAFLLRYDDGVNPLIDMPLAYGYYYKPVSTKGLAGVGIDVTIRRFDMRAQFTNSSPASARDLWQSDQYGSWAGGLGYTIAQGFRVGASAYRGPYLYAGHQYFFPGEARPKDLPATGLGVDVQWARGHWNVYGELQRFQMAYKLIPTFGEDTGYVEVRRALSPRWYVASRLGYIRSNAFPTRQVLETAVGYRPNRYQLIKVGYQMQRGDDVRGTLANTLAMQLVTMLRPISIAQD